MIGLPIKQARLVLLATKVTLLGNEVNTLNQTLALPLEKVVSLRQKLISPAKRKKGTLKELQSLIGSLNFACRAIDPVREFLRRLIEMTKDTRRPNHRIRLTVETRKDIEAWLEFMQNFNGVVF